MDDFWEVSNKLDPLTDDSELDPDKDGLSNLDEYVYNTNPQISLKRVEFFTINTTYVLAGIAGITLYYRKRNVKKIKD